jgi:hypothetical protein
VRDAGRGANNTRNCSVSRAAMSLTSSMAPGWSSTLTRTFLAFIYRSVYSASDFRLQQMKDDCKLPS